MRQRCANVVNQSWKTGTEQFQPLTAQGFQLSGNRCKPVVEVNGSDFEKMLAQTISHVASMPMNGRWIALIAPPSLPMEKILKSHGISLKHVLMVHPRDSTDTLWTVERALQSGTCCAVLAWPDHILPRDVRRLQLAAGSSETLSVLFTKNDRSKELDMGYRILAEQSEPTFWHSNAFFSKNRLNDTSSRTLH